MEQASLKEQIKSDMIAAMRSKDTATLGVIRMLQAAIKQKEIDSRITVEDPEVLVIIEKMIKQRRDAASQFEQGNRPELAAKELQEITVLQQYLPKQLSDNELEIIIATAIKDIKATSMKEMSLVMEKIKPQIQSRADKSKVSAKVKAMLT